MVKRNGETVEYQVILNIPHLRGKNQQNLRESPCFLREWSSSDRSWLSQRTCLSLCGGSRETGLPSQSRSARQLSHRESPWQAGQLPTGRLSPDMAQKGGPCYRGQRLLDKRTLSSCRESWQRSTTVSDTSYFIHPALARPTRQRCFAPGLRLPASAALRLRLAGRCPNNDFLFPPLAAVVVVAPSGGAGAKRLRGLLPGQHSF